MRYIKNAKLILETGILWDGVLAMDGEKIASFGLASEMKIPKDADVIDAEGLYVGPGFVDIHVHGGGGVSFWEEPEKVSEYFLKKGTTTILATLPYNLSRDAYLRGIELVKKAKADSHISKAIGGFYMEGPYLNPKYGANADINPWRGDIVPEDYKELADNAGKLAKVWTVAPEREGLKPFLEYAKKVNPDVRFAVGHSEATPEQIQKLKKYGIGLQTHCMDATGRVETWLGTRSCGPDEYCMTDSDMYAEVICDSQGIHVNPALVRMILKVKGVDKIVLITDCYVSDDQAPEGLRHVTDLNFDHNGDLCGSRLTMDVACKNMMTHTNCGIAQAFLMASRNPARAIGMEDEIGTIEAGKKANLVFVDDMFRVNKVILEGEIYE